MGDVAALTRPLTQPGGLLYVPSKRIRRCLFGPMDHEKTRSDLDDYMKKLMEQNKERWNFDFENERPLPPGRYVWEKVGAPSDADSNGGSEKQEDEEKSGKHEKQTLITDFMRKRKLSNGKETTKRSPKIRRRCST